MRAYIPEHPPEARCMEFRTKLEALVALAAKLAELPDNHPITQGSAGWFLTSAAKSRATRTKRSQACRLRACRL
jgi:hypothetical protein